MISRLELYSWYNFVVHQTILWFCYFPLWLDWCSHHHTYNWCSYAVSAFSIHFVLSRNKIFVECWFDAAIQLSQLHHFLHMIWFDSNLHFSLKIVLVETRIHICMTRIKNHMLQKTKICKISTWNCSCSASCKFRLCWHSDMDVNKLQWYVSLCQPPL